MSDAGYMPNAALAAQNADLRRRLEALQVKVANLHRPIGDLERVEIVEAERRATELAARLGGGLTVSVPGLGETALDYRRRVLRPFLQFSRNFQGSDLSTVAHPATLALIENEVYADAEAAAKVRAESTPARLVTRVERDAAGRQITKFDGDIMAWLAPFVADGARCRIQRGES